ncbi:MAG: hypothetical protein LUF35_01525 [Lachnospiraceae bacterium]|nr:hypothetical protein [Lachnospiraceae bacterium]
MIFVFLSDMNVVINVVFRSDVKALAYDIPLRSAFLIQRHLRQKGKPPNRQAAKQADDQAAKQQQNRQTGKRAGGQTAKPLNGQAGRRPGSQTAKPPNGQAARQPNSKTAKAAKNRILPAQSAVKIFFRNI